MAGSLHDSRVTSVLDRLFAEAALDEDAAGWRPGPSFDAATPLERADAMAGVYMTISQSGGRLLYLLARAIRPSLVVEFGASYGISTIFLAAAAADNGAGRVLSTELSETKIAAARANLAEAGLAASATILAGDAMATLAGIDEPVGLALLDGWKDMCLPVLKLIEPHLAAGALVVADDTAFPSMAPYLAYVRDPANGYVTVAFPVEDGMEISCRAGR